MQPSARKLFFALYVTGNLAISGGISMQGRGGNNSSTGANITAQDILIATGTFSGVSNPQVPAAGGSKGLGGSAVDGSNAGTNPTAGTAGGTGGGGQGSNASSSNGGTATSGNGADGTSFSGGVAGGAARTVGGTVTAGSGVAGNGAGGDGNSNQSGVSALGGSGNPSGANSAQGNTCNAPVDGGGGVFFGICLGTFSGGGTVVCDGNIGGVYVSGGNTGFNGGGSGGGSATILYGTDSSTITPTANGGSPTGAAGTARKLAL